MYTVLIVEWEHKNILPPYTMDKMSHIGESKSVGATKVYIMESSHVDWTRLNHFINRINSSLCFI